MRVALDARTLQPALRGGIGRSLANLVPLLRDQVELHLLTDSRYPRVVCDLPQTQLRTPVPKVSMSWLQLSVPPFLRTFPGVFHCPYYALPYWLPVPGVVTMHDITFEHFPEWFSPVHGPAHRIQARRAAKTAAVVLTCTEFVRKDVIETYRVDPDKVLVAPQGTDPCFRPDRDPAPLLASLGVSRPYLVALGGAQRRNLGLAVQAWRTVVAEGDEVDLVVVGPALLPPEAGLHCVGGVPDEVLATLLTGALAFVYPTSYEGFGMPGLEALAAGAPVVAARRGSVPEVLGDAAVWADSLEPADLAAALHQVVSGSSSQLAALRTCAVEHAASRPGWPEAAAIHLHAYAMASGS
jgi:glycosyltransferase involved in cell wall biosynthesis